MFPSRAREEQEKKGKEKGNYGQESMNFEDSQQLVVRLSRLKEGEWLEVTEICVGVARL